MKTLKSKTIIFAIVVFILGGVQAFVDNGIIPANVAGYVTMAIGVIIGALRKVTDKPLSQK